MSMEALAWAAKQPITPVSRKYVLSTLADKANGDGECWPTIAAICEAVGLKERMVRRHIRALVDCGYVTTENRGRQTNLFRLNLTGTPVPVNAGTEIPVNEIDNRYSSTPDLQALTGTPVHLNRYSSTAPTLLTQKNPKTPYAGDAPTQACARDIPAWLQTLVAIEPGKLSNGMNRSGVDADDKELIAWAEGKKISPDVLEEVAGYVASAWHGQLRSRGRENVRATFQNLVNRELRRDDRTVQRPSTGRVTPPRDDELTVAHNR